MKRIEVQQPRALPCLKSYDEVPKPPPTGVLIKTKYCGICHSDLHLSDNAGFMRKVKFPVIYGHEVSGTVHSFGENADLRDLKIGDNVMVYPWIGCGSCVECDEGQYHLCMDRLQEIGCGADGGYSSYVPVKDTRYLVKVPDTVPMDVACMLPCSGVTSYSALAKVRPILQKAGGKGSLLVIGAGGLGLWCIQWAKSCLPEGTTVVCADISKEKVEIASRHGADGTIVWSDPGENDEILDDGLSAELQRKSNVGGFDAVIDFVGTSITSMRGYDSAKKGGTYVVVGLFEGSLTLQLPVLVRKIKAVMGSYVGSIQELRELVQLVATSTVKPPPIIHYRIEDVTKAWKILEAGKMLGRAIIKHE